MKRNQIPDEILKNVQLNQRIQQYLPDNYNFEIHKTIWRIERNNCKRICLQFPDGLFIFAIPIVDILREYFNNNRKNGEDDVEFIIMSDVTYGACCIDDIKAKELDCDMIIHYGHSCLIPIKQMVNGVSILYIFVDIKFDLINLIQIVRKNFPSNDYHICLSSTIQFLKSTHLLAKELREKYDYTIHIPQSRPLTSGEILGCTAPKLQLNIDDEKIPIIIFIADGRFHLEALMIANPLIPAYRYDPYDKKMTLEKYDYNSMIEQRIVAIKSTINALKNERKIGIIIGTLGRQGNMRIVNTLESLLRKKSIQSQIILFTISEINSKILNELNNNDNGKDEIECWIQIGCPRLSIDWGDNFNLNNKPLITPFEFRTAIKFFNEENQIESYFRIDKNGQGNYPMDFYANNSLGAWTPNHKCNDNCEC